MLAGLAGMLGACSSEEPATNGPQNTGEPVGYVKLALGDQATRANDDAEGTAEESKIETAQFFFYDDDNQLIATKTVTADQWLDTQKHNANKCVVLSVDNIKITQVAVLVNGSISGSLDNAPDAHTTNGMTGTNFKMFSATTYDDSNAITYRVPLGKLYATYAEAEAAGDNDVSMIYVERLYAKVNITKDAAYSVAINNLTEGNSDTKVTVTFEPEKVFVTATNKNSYYRKRLPAWSSLDEELQDIVKGPNTTYWCRGYLAGDATGLASINLPSYNEVTNDKLWTNNTTYVFDHVGSSLDRYTSVIVAGKYDVKVNGTSIAAADGSFWLVADEGQFNVYDSEEKAIAAMGGNEDSVLTYDAKTGWSSIAESPIKCMHFDLGLGYYSKGIKRFDKTADHLSKSYYGIVRNHVYNVNITGITGMGIGINDPDEPIIPIDPKDPSNQQYYLHMSVKVNPWTVVKQNVAW